MRHLVDEVGVTALDGPCQRLRFLAELQQQRDLRASRRYKRRTKNVPYRVGKNPAKCHSSQLMDFSIEPSLH